MRNVSLECLAAARRVAEGGTITAAVFGSKAREFADTLAHHGADKVVVATDEKLDQYTTDAYFQAFKQVIDKVQPDVILTGHTAIGRDVSPRIAARMDGGSFPTAPMCSRPGTGRVIHLADLRRKGLCEKGGEGRAVVATIRPNNVPALEADIPVGTGGGAGCRDFRRFPADDRERGVRKTAGGVDLTAARDRCFRRSGREVPRDSKPFMSWPRSLEAPSAHPAPPPTPDTAITPCRSAKPARR